jgi:carotenoid cleavage dioxygenase-like enzyme
MVISDGLAVGFRSLTEEVSDRALPVSGSIPGWLDGSLVRNGPGRFEVGGDRVEHWFDGLAMLQRFAFDGAGVRYTNRFLRSDAYDRAMRTGDLPGQFATGSGYLRRLWRLLAGTRTDNCNVHVARLDGELVALTEVPTLVSVDPATLETGGRFEFADDLGGHLVTAHLIPDPHRGETVGVSTEFGRTSRYHLFAVTDGSRRRRELAEIETAKPAYVHSVALARDHVVLTEHPFRLDPWSFLTPGGAGFVDHLDWEPERGTRFHVIHRDAGRVVARHHAPANFVFHHVNAFEVPPDVGDAGDRTVVVDLVDYPDASVVDGLRLDGLAEWLTSGIDGRLRRFRLPTERNATVSGTTLAAGLELPRIAPASRTRRHRYVYAQGSATADGNHLLKVDVETGETTTWSESGLFVEEPVPVPHPDRPGDGDAGVVLATALDVRAERSVLLVLDAETLTERARATLPHHLPFGFHGRYFSDPTQTG